LGPPHLASWLKCRNSVTFKDTEAQLLRPQNMVCNMLARFTVLLPFSLTVPQGESLQPYEFQRGAYRIKIYPPLQANIDYAELGMCSPLSLGEIILKVQPAPPKTTDMVLINNAPTIQMNLLQIDFMKEDFDRSPSSDPERQLDTGEPPARFA